MLTDESVEEEFSPDIIRLNTGFIPINEGFVLGRRITRLRRIIRLTDNSSLIQIRPLILLFSNVPVAFAFVVF